MRGRVAAMLGQDIDALVYWTAAEIDRAISDANVEIAHITGALEIIESINTTASDATYEPSDSVGTILRVQYDDRPIFPTTKWELDRTLDNWENLTGYVYHYTLTLMHTDRSVRQIRLYKTPEVGASGVFDSNYGVVTDISDTDSNTYTFTHDGIAGSYAEWLISSAYTKGTYIKTTISTVVTGYICIADHTSALADYPGVGANWTTYWNPLSELGVVIDTAGGDWPTSFNTDLGVIVDLGFDDYLLKVWAKKIPDALEDDEDESELPEHAHLGVCYRAASRLLRKAGEMRDRAKSKAYEELAGEYVGFLKGLVSQRAPERLTVMRPGGLRRRTFIEQQRDQIIEDS